MNNTKPIGKWRLRIGFASADLACNLVWQMISLYLLFFYTNVMGSRRSCGCNDVFSNKNN